MSAASFPALATMFPVSLLFRVYPLPGGDGKRKDIRRSELVPTQPQPPLHTITKIVPVVRVVTLFVTDFIGKRGKIKRLHITEHDP